MLSLSTPNPYRCPRGDRIQFPCRRCVSAKSRAAQGSDAGAQRCPNLEQHCTRGKWKSVPFCSLACARAHFVGAAHPFRPRIFISALSGSPAGTAQRSHKADIGIHFGGDAAFDARRYAFRRSEGAGGNVAWVQTGLKFCCYIGDNLQEVSCSAARAPR